MCPYRMYPFRMAHASVPEPRPRRRHKPLVAVPAHWPQDVRSSILSAVALAAAERGFAETRVTDVIARAGVSRRTFYIHFSDRESCFFAAYEAVRSDALALLTPDDDSDQRWQDRLDAALRRGLEYCAAWPHHATLLLVEILSAGPEGARRHEQTMAELSGLFVDCGAWRPVGRAALEPSELAQALVGAMHRLVQARLLGGRPEELPSLASGLAALAVAGSR
jgi:AcrR family transcriptional regulator